MPKKENIEQLFDNIAPTYDKLNHLLSLNIDRAWRRRAVREIMTDCGVHKHTYADAAAHTPKKGTSEPLRILDVASGTGDFAIAIAKRAGAGSVITGIDLSENMLSIGREKAVKAGFAREDGSVEKRGDAERTVTIDLKQGDCENLSFPDGNFDRVCAAFGVRNFEHIGLGLSEMRRVLVDGGKSVILELSIPQNKFAASLYRVYFEYILPWIGKTISGDKPAYKYLPASVLNFPAPEKFCEMLRGAGFTDVRHKAFSFGICRMYVGCKK